MRGRLERTRKRCDLGGRTFSRQTQNQPGYRGPRCREHLPGPERLQTRLRFGAFAWDDQEGTILFTHTILGGTTLDADELVATLSDVALIADEYDDKLMAKYGGQRMLDLLEEAALERILEKSGTPAELD